MKIRVGFGFDVHKLVTGRELWLGGIRLEHEMGLLGHSDADVLIHAICDALLGAANMRDIGYHFPDNSADFKNIDSKILLSGDAGSAGTGDGGGCGRRVHQGHHHRKIRIYRT